MIVSVSSDLPTELSNKVNALLTDFINEARLVLQQKNLNLLLMPMFKNHNRLVVIDSANIHVLYTTEGVTSPVSSQLARDFRNKGVMTQKEVVEAAARELSYKDIHYFLFPIASLDIPSDDQKSLLQNVVESYILNRIEPLIKLQRIGLGESLTYLQNARARFETQTAEGYADCKTNCRSALVSAIKSLTGQEKLREGVKLLAKKGVFGEREMEFIDAFGDLLASLHSVASKKGPHPPLPDQEDSELVLGVTTSVMTYIAARELKIK